ncbi:30S ribosomal protein S9 [Patescibacteria group bacterium]|nr:30S ribosomal protein S9 [Patescibacteria group bacterium]
MVPKAKVKAKAAVKTESVSKKPAAPSKKLDYLYAVGKRKSSVSRVRLYTKKTEGKFIVNQKDYRQSFPYFEHQQIIIAPLKLLGLEGKYDISIKVSGGGTRGQAESIRHGLSRILLKIDSNFRKTLKGAGFLTRDPREKERKKPGLKRARRAPQWAKR